MMIRILRSILSVATIFYTVISMGLSQAELMDKADIMPGGAALAVDAVTEPETTVHILQSREEIGFELQQAIDLYNIDMPSNMQVSVQTVGGGDDYHSALRAKLLAGEGADLFHISGSRELLELKEHVRELDFLSWLSDAYPGSLDAVTRDGRVYGVPYSIEATGLICNRGVFEEAGISLVEIQSFEALSEAFSELNGKIKAGELGEDFMLLEAVCEFPAQDKAFLGAEFADVALSGAFESPAEAAESESVKFPAMGPVEELVKLMARFSVNDDGWNRLAGIGRTQQIERFANGRVAVIMEDTNIYRRISELGFKTQYRAFLLPIPLDTFEQPSVYAGVPVYWAVNTASGEKARDYIGGLLTWLYRSDEGAKCLAGDFMAVSPFRDTADDTGFALHGQMLSYLGAGMGMPRIHREFPKGWGRDVFAPNVQSYFTDREKTWEEAIKACEEGWIG